MRTTVWLSDGGVAEIGAEARQAGRREVGGVLMGYITGMNVVVTDVIGPGPRAQLREDEFRPDSDWQSREIARIYGESGRTTTYLGDWHTHPESAPAPSPKDMMTAKRIARTKESRVRRPVMLILGKKNDGQLALAGYRYVRGRLRACTVKLYRATAIFGP